MTVAEEVDSLRRAVSGQKGVVYRIVYSYGNGYTPEELDREVDKLNSLRAQLKTAREELHD